MSAISVEHLSRWWGPTRAVDDVSFEAAAGKMLVLLGPSGCGKSTTLRLIAGLETATAGRIAIGGVDVTHLPPAERRLSMVFQSYALFPAPLGGREHRLRPAGAPGARGRARARGSSAVADLLGLDGLLARKPSQLSGGQQQRVALGRAIIAETPVCLMDEPLSNLDAQLRLEMRREIRALQQRLGITMVYVTHDQTEAMSMADQVILLRDGRVEQDAAPDRALRAARHRLHRPLHRHAAHEHPRRWPTARAARSSRAPPAPALPAAAAGRRGCCSAMRPEDITPGRAASAEGVAATVKSVEYLGADSHLDLRGGRARPSRCGRRDGSRCPPGAPVRLRWNPDATHVFDAQSGDAVDERRAPSDSIPISR